MRLFRSFVCYTGLLVASIGPALAGTNHAVSVGGNRDVFTPAQLPPINAGDTVTFTWVGGMAHNVVADDGSFRCAKGCDGDGHGGNGNVASNWSATVTFPTAGTFRYYCEAHGGKNGVGMSGTITVNDVAPPPPTFTVRGGLSGNWDNPTAGQDGHGFQFEILPNNSMLAIWFVFTPDGSGQTWLYSQGGYDPTSNTVTLPVFRALGAKFPPNYLDTANTVTPWGSLTFTFTDCNNGTATWASNTASSAAGYQSLAAFPITRVTTIAGTTCP